MAENDKEKILRILATQSPDYLIHPTATAFVVEGLNPIEVEHFLDQLADEGLVRVDEIVAQKTIPQKDDKGHDIPGTTALDPITHKPILVDITDEKGPVVVDAGWCVTEAGKAKHQSRRDHG